jgi:hypothetical protein
MPLTHHWRVAIRHAGALCGFYVDMKERSTALTHALRPEMGFQERAGGVWTWRFKQNEITRSVEAPSGSAVHIAGILGFPFIRLRAALPEELFAGTVAQALGRKAGMSVSGLADAREDNLTIFMQLKAGLSCFGRTRDQIPEFDLERSKSQGPHPGPPRAQTVTESANSAEQQRPRLSTADYDADVGDSVVRVHMWETTTGIRVDCSARDDAPPPAEPADLVGTALMFAFMAIQKLLPVVELSERRAAAAAHFAEVRVPGIDFGFDDLLAKARCARVC